MENLELPPRFPEEDDGFTTRVPSAPAQTWWALSLVALALMLVAGAAVLG